VQTPLKNMKKAGGVFKNTPPAFLGFFNGLLSHSTLKPYTKQSLITPYYLPSISDFKLSCAGLFDNQIPNNAFLNAMPRNTVMRFAFLST